MPVITFANTKGGAGKTTAVLLLATELERMGFRVTVLDADPQYWISRWRENSGDRTKVKVVPYVTQATLEKHIHEGKREADYVLIDLPGARPDRVKQQLSEMGLVPDDWDGDTMVIPVSAREKQGIDDLLEAVLLTAEEVSTLDLAGTDWVVLSACHSGVGEAWAREGQLGMRRAFHLAGARTVGRGPQAPPPSGLRMRGERPGKASRRASRPSVLPADFMCL